MGDPDGWPDTESPLSILRLSGQVFAQLDEYEKVPGSTGGETRSPAGEEPLLSRIARLVTSVFRKLRRAES